MNCYVLIGERPQQNRILSDSGTFAMVFDTQQEARNYQKHHPLERFDNPPVEVDRQWMIDQIPQEIAEYLDEGVLPRYADGYRNAADITEFLVNEAVSWRKQELDNFLDGLSERLQQQFNTFATGQTEFYMWLLVSPVRAALITAYIQSVFTEWELKLSRTNQKIGKEAQQWSINGK